jgi:hypothetical protein
MKQNNGKNAALAMERGKLRPSLSKIPMSWLGFSASSFGALHLT